MTEGIKVVQSNPKARHDYEILEVREAGIVLVGTEVKSIRAGQVSIREAYAKIRGGELWLLSMHVGPYLNAGYATHDAKRPRKLLLHRSQIAAWDPHVRQKGYTIVPLKLYFKQGLAKVEVALARGRAHHDKREAIREREDEREMARRRARPG